MKITTAKLLTALLLSFCLIPAVMSEELSSGPVLYRPEMNSIILEKSVTLQWQYFEGANLFRVQAAYDRDFSSLFLDDTSIYHFYTFNDLPRDGSKIFWRVKACVISADEENPDMQNLTCISEWSKAYTFFTGIPEEEGESGEEDTNFFRRVFGCERIDEEDSLLSRVRNWLPLLVSMLIILQIRTPKVNS